MHDIIIVGGGTAGLTAAIYGVRAGRSVLVIEGQLPGGQIISSPEIENYPGIKKISGADFASALYDQAHSLGAEFTSAQVTGLRADPTKAVVTAKKEYLGRTVILATGSKPRPLGVEREESLIGRGISYCATCDGAFFKGREVAVVGGGNTALEDAAFLAQYCQKVTLIHRRSSFRGEAALVRALEAKPNVAFLMESQVTALLGGEGLEGVEINHSYSLPIAGLFVAVGHMPQNAIFSPPVALNEHGYILAGEDCKTNIPGIFAAGDCRTKTVRQLSTASADGTVAALAACEWLQM